MNTLSILSYGGITALIVLIVVFEIKDYKGCNYRNNNGYVYYTYNNIAVRIRHLFSSQYRVYVYNNCPIQTKKDRYGTYFSLKGHSAADIEYQVDELYRRD